MNFQDFFFEANAKRNALDLTEFQNQVHYRKFLREWVILMVTDLVII